MRHPFDLQQAELTALDLNFEETLTDEEAQQIGGGLRYYHPFKPPHYLGPPIKLPPIKPFPLPCDPIPSPTPEPEDPPMMTTLALGEEGGSSVFID